MQRRLALFSPLLLLALLAGAAAGQSSAPELTPLRFVPLTPCRAIDTRINPALSTPAGGPSVTIPMRGKCGIPEHAKAYSLNITAVPIGPLSYMTLWPAGEPQPFTSLLNSWTGTPVAAATIIRAGVGGAINVYVTNATNFLVDVNGYFVDSPSDLAFFPLPPCRVVDSRLIASLVPWFGGGQSRRVDLLGRCGVPATAQAYSLNFTVVAGTEALGHLTAYPSGKPQPNVSTLNAWQGGTVANAAIVAAGDGGAIEVFVSDTTDVVIDINGYFAPYNGDGALSLFIRPPCRIVDTRPGQGTSGTLGPPSLGAGETRDLDLRSGRCYVPPPLITTKPEPIAYVMNATVVPKASLGYLTLWASGPGRPLVSTLNSSLTATAVSNMAIVQGGVSDRISAFASDQTDLILDLSGWFANTWR